MSCYSRHMKDVFDEARVVVTKDNKKAVDAAIHKAVGVPYKDCPAAWKALKPLPAEPAGRKKLVAAIEKA